MSFINATTILISATAITLSNVDIICTTINKAANWSELKHAAQDIINGVKSHDGAKIIQPIQSIFTAVFDTTPENNFPQNLADFTKAKEELINNMDNTQDKISADSYLHDLKTHQDIHKQYIFHILHKIEQEISKIEDNFSVLSLLNQMGSFVKQLHDYFIKKQDSDYATKINIIRADINQRIQQLESTKKSPKTFFNSTIQHIILSSLPMLILLLEGNRKYEVIVSLFTCKHDCIKKKANTTHVWGSFKESTTKLSFSKGNEYVDLVRSLQLIKDPQNSAPISITRIKQKEKLPYAFLKNTQELSTFAQLINSLQDFLIWQQEGVDTIENLYSKIENLCLYHFKIKHDLGFTSDSHTPKVDILEENNRTQLCKAFNALEAYLIVLYEKSKVENNPTLQNKPLKFDFLDIIDLAIGKKIEQTTEITPQNALILFYREHYDKNFFESILDITGHHYNNFFYGYYKDKKRETFAASTEQKIDSIALTGLEKAHFSKIQGHEKLKNDFQKNIAHRLDQERIFLEAFLTYRNLVMTLGKQTLRNFIESKRVNSKDWDLLSQLDKDVLQNLKAKYLGQEKQKDSSEKEDLANLAWHLFLKSYYKNNSDKTPVLFFSVFYIESILCKLTLLSDTEFAASKQSITDKMLQFFFPSDISPLKPEYFDRLTQILGNFLKDKSNAFSEAKKNLQKESGEHKSAIIKSEFIYKVKALLLAGASGFSYIDFALDNFHSSTEIIVETLYTLPPELLLNYLYIKGADFQGAIKTITQANGQAVFYNLRKSLEDFLCAFVCRLEKIPTEKFSSQDDAYLKNFAKVHLTILSKAYKVLNAFVNSTTSISFDKESSCEFFSLLKKTKTSISEYSTTSGFTNPIIRFFYYFSNDCILYNSLSNLEKSINEFLDLTIHVKNRETLIKNLNDSRPSSMLSYPIPSGCYQQIEQELKMSKKRARKATEKADKATEKADKATEKADKATENIEKLQVCQGLSLVILSGDYPKLCDHVHKQISTVKLISAETVQELCLQEASAFCAALLQQCPNNTKVAVLAKAVGQYGFTPPPVHPLKSPKPLAGSMGFFSEKSEKTYIDQPQSISAPSFS